MAIFILDNTIQKYDWGTKDALAKLLGLKNQEKEPWAELWMGAHPKSPSTAINPHNQEKTKLDKLIASNPKAFLGKNIAKKFDNSLPFLLKVLSANKPLSIQAHPSKHKAEKGFAREEFFGIPLDAPERNYKDTNNKPETLVAITPFEALCGFRPIEEIIYYIKLLVPKDWENIAGRLAKNPGKLELSVLFYTFISNKQTNSQLNLDYVKKRCKQILANKETNISDQNTFSWILKLMDYYPGDVGCLAPIVLNLLKLHKWEAINLPSSQPHAYLKGTAIEIMANSDNVVRGGLTTKHKDIPEFIACLSFDSLKIEALKGIPQSDAFFVYPSENTEYRISKMELDGQLEISGRADSPEILLCLEGSLNLKSKDATAVTMKQGSSVFITADEESYTLAGKAVLVRADVPL